MFKIKANPTFPATVKISVAGGEIEELKVVFKHKRLEDAAKYFQEAQENNMHTAELVFGLLDSWQADAPLTVDSIKDLFQEKPKSIDAFPRTYREELIGAIEGN